MISIKFKDGRGYRLYTFTVQCTVSMIDLGIFFLKKKSLSEVFGRIKLDKKESRNIFYFFFNKESYLE